ncbi:NAD(P)H-dependent oxidoreductase [Pseudomonas sp.]|nr:NAD(P)H-dependent oxidoreductase [Pseudomonas sp.]
MSTRILIICGSDRPASASLKISNYINNLCAENPAVESVQLIDLNQEKIPLWDEGFWVRTPRWESIWHPISCLLKDSDGFIIVTPEWGGMVPPTLKNFLLLCEPSEVGHKPNLIVSCSSSRGGAQPIVELRTSGYKNNKLCHIPDHIHIQKVDEVIKEITSGRNCYFAKRIDWSVKVLLSYAQALKPMRQASFLFDSAYEHGM